MSKHEGGSGSDSFMPALLDRLSVHGSGAMNRSTFRKTVLRDLAWLLNCTNLASHAFLNEFPNARDSVINFGIPSLAGSRFAEADFGAMAEAIQHAIEIFEPRILKNSLKVSVAHGTGIELYNHARFIIEVTYWFEPYPIDMLIRAQWDMDTGGVEIHDEG